MARVYLFSILQDLGSGSDYFLDALCVGHISVRHSRPLIGNKHHWSSWKAVVQVIMQRCSIAHKNMYVADGQVCRIGVSRASRKATCVACMKDHCVHAYRN